ncbi:MAG: hypothetical protein CES88_08030 [Halobacteriovorax sp. JY17]|nr:MAG: hypothetical protein CES88_08030 [Halobacteriovorax sp. JY17]
MEILKTTLIFKISLLALYGSWGVAQESRCQSEKHHLLLKKITSAIVKNRNQTLFKCNQILKVQVNEEFITIDKVIGLKK